MVQSPVYRKRGRGWGGKPNARCAEANELWFFAVPAGRNFSAIDWPERPKVALLSSRAMTPEEVYQQRDHRYY